MSAGWVAASVRSRAAATRRLGPELVRSLAASPDLATAASRLGTGPYRHGVRAGQDLAELQHAVAADYLWNLRVLAGWSPPGGVEALRALAAWAEIANVDGLLRQWSGAQPLPAYALGSLSTDWAVLRTASSRGELRRLLAASQWGDPGADDDHGIQLAMRLAWCARVAARVQIAAEWARAAAVVLVAHEAAVGASIPSGLCARVLGPTVAAARGLDEMRATVPASLAWVLRDVAGPEQLWRAETAWWRRLEEDGSAMAASSHYDLTPVVGRLALLAVDAWRVRAALELASRGGRPPDGLDDLL